MDPIVLCQFAYRDMPVNVRVDLIESVRMDGIYIIVRAAGHDYRVDGSFNDVLAEWGRAVKLYQQEANTAYAEATSESFSEQLPAGSMREALGQPMTPWPIPTSDAGGDYG